MPARKPICQEGLQWLKDRNGRRALDSFTGTTSRAFAAYLHLLQCWIASPTGKVERALMSTVEILSASEWHLAAEAIACIGDWGHIEPLWSRIKPIGAPDYVAQDGRVLAVLPGE